MVFFLPMTLFSLASSKRELAVFDVLPVIPDNPDYMDEIARDRQSELCADDIDKCPGFAQDCTLIKKCKTGFICGAADSTNKRKCRSVLRGNNNSVQEARRAERAERIASLRKVLADNAALQNKVRAWRWEMHKNRSCGIVDRLTDLHIWDQSIEQCKMICDSLPYCTTIVIGNHGTLGHKLNYCGWRKRTKDELKSSSSKCEKNNNWITIQSPDADIKIAKYER